MRQILFLILILASTQSFAQKKTSKSTKPKPKVTAVKQVSMDQVPLIDRKLFFGNPAIAGGQLSPNGKYITFMKELDGIMNVWVKNIDEPFEKARPLTDSKNPLSGYFWTYDSKYILFLKDNEGDENRNIFAVDPNDAPAAGSKVPSSRNLTPLKDVAVQILSVSKKNPDLMYVGINDRDKAWHDLYKLEIKSGKLTKIFENTKRLTAWIFDWEETPRLAMTTDEKGNSEILSVTKNNEFKSIYSTNVKESAYPIGWTPDNKLAYLISNKGDVNLSTLYTMDPVTGNVVKVESDPKNKVDINNVFFDDNTHKMIYTSYTEDKERIYWKDKTWEAHYKFLQSKFPGKEIDVSSATSDYSKWLVTEWGDATMPKVYYFEPSTKKLKFQYTPRPDMIEYEKYLSPMTPISYKSSDGLVIPAYLTLPKGHAGKNLPLIALVHGGPKGPRDGWGYNGLVQFLANRGYAVLQPNFRASGGYGKAFLNAGDKEWGAKMQDDITYGVKDLIKSGVVNKDRVAIMGGSYGGYATLAGLTFTPDLYKCGVDIVGPSNLYTLLESIPAYWESGRAWLYEMVGDPNTEEGKKLIERASPLFHADKIVRPLMIIQGANDPRVKKAESDQIVIKLRDKGADVQYLLAKDEGHGFAKPLNRMAQYAATEKFLAKHLNGRFQSEMPEDVANTLKDLTVDINTVKLEPKVEVKVDGKGPQIMNNVSAGTSAYTMNIEVQGQKIPIDITRTVKVEGDKYIIKEEGKSMIGDISDEFVYDKSWKPISRNYNQGGQQMDFTFNDNKATMKAMGQEMNLEGKSIIYTDGAGFDYILGGMPLAEGFSTSLSLVDMMSGKVNLTAINVTGKETINGVNTFVVELVDPENSGSKVIYYIDPKAKLSVKSVQSMTSPLPMTITTEKK